jgi:hypothetical protein
MRKKSVCRVPPDERSSDLRWHHENPEAARANVLLFDAKNPGRRAAITKEWRAKNPKYSKAWKKRNPDRVRQHQKSSKLKAAYGITLAEYEAMLTAQGGVCAACGNPPGKKSLAVDHDHETAKIRALLCTPCNTTIGQMRESPERLRKLIAYLEKHKP